MKKLIAGMFCLTMMAVFARAEYPGAGENPSNQDRLNAAVQQAVSAQQGASQEAQPVKIPGGKRLVIVRLDVQEPDQGSDKNTLHHTWNCPAVVFNKEGALAFDGECWKAFEKAAQLSIGPTVQFTVDLGNFGDYTSGDNFGNPFFFMATYVAEGPGDEYVHSVKESFKRSNDKAYIVYKRSMFNDPMNKGNADNSQAKKAIADYYAQNNLKEVTAETLSQYFSQKHPRFQKTITRFP